MSIMSVQIQCKSSLNQGLTDKLKGKNLKKGSGGERMGRPGLSPPPI